MNSFNLLDPEPITIVRTLAAPIFSTNEVAVAPKQPSGAVRRPVGKRDTLLLGGHSSPGDIADDEDEPVSENDGGAGFGDDEETDENAASRILKRSRSVDSNATINPNKKIKISGGRAATHRDVTHILDSDDEIIYNMKRAGQKDESVVQRLIDEGRTKYQVKTIPTRYSRILLKMEEHQEQRLEEEFSDFHEEDHNALKVAQEEILTWYQRQRDILETKRWREVSKRLNGKLSKPKYSKKACQELAEAIADGTAIIPLEKDSTQNQEARRAQAQQQIEKRKADRLAAEEEATRPIRERQKIKDEENRIKAEARAEKEEEMAKKRAEREAEQAKKDAAKAERERERKLKLKREERLRKAKQEELEQKKRTKEELKAAKEKAKEEEKAAKQQAKLLAKLSKVQESAQATEDKIRVLAAEALATTIMNKGVMEEIKKITTSTSPDLTSSTTTSTNTKKKTNTKTSATPTARKPATPKKSAKTKAKAPSTPSSAVSKIPNKPKASAAKPKPRTSLLPTNPTNTGPIRASMNVNQLRVLSRNRGLGVSGKKEVLVQNLTRDDSLKSLEALKRVLVERELDCSGTKQELIDRIANDDVAKAAGEGMNMTV